MERTPIQKWRELEQDDKLLSKEIHNYLKHYHGGTQLAVYEHRWRKYIKEKKQPHYDTIKYHFLYETMIECPERKRLQNVIKQKNKQPVKVSVGTDCPNAFLELERIK